MEPQIQYAKTSDGVNIAFASVGSGPPLVRTTDPLFSHLSVAWQRSGLRADIESLAESFQVVRYDPRGTGLSQREPLDSSLEARLLDVDTVAEKLGLERFALMGSGHGTPVAIAFAARRVERVTHLILQRSYTQGTQYYDDSPARRFTSSFSDEMVREQWEFVTQAFANRSISDPSRATELAQLIRAAITPQAYLAFREAALAIDVSGLLPKIVAPTLVLYGERDQPEFSREIAAAIPNARLVVTQPNEPVVPIIMEFLGVRKGAAPGTESPPGVGTSGGFRTILFTDIVGHTEMMQRLGDDAGRTVLREHERITREALSAHGGVEVKTDGDSFMATFASVSSAVECAVALQRAFATYGETTGEPIVVRMGLNVGEPIEEDGDYFGSAVILGARIKDQAGGGEILVPEAVRHLLSGKPFLFADRGVADLKGFEDPVRLYEVRWREDA